MDETLSEIFTATNGVTLTSKNLHGVGHVVVDTATGLVVCEGSLRECDAWVRTQRVMWGSTHFVVEYHAPKLNPLPHPTNPVANVPTEVVSYSQVYDKQDRVRRMFLAWSVSPENPWRDTREPLLSVESATSDSERRAHLATAVKVGRPHYTSDAVRGILANESDDVYGLWKLYNVSTLAVVKQGTRAELLPWLSKVETNGKLHKVRAVREHRYDEYVAMVLKEGWVVIDRRTNCIIVRGTQAECEAFLIAEGEYDSELLSNVVIYCNDDAFERALVLASIR